MSEALWLGLLSALWALTVTLGAIILKLMKDRITRLETETADQRSQIAAFQTNYLTRFQEMNDNLHKVKDAIIEEVHKIQLQCAVHSFTGKQ